MIFLRFGHGFIINMFCISTRDLYNRSYKVGAVLFTDRTRFLKIFFFCFNFSDVYYNIETQPAFPIPLALAYLLITYKCTVVFESDLVLWYSSYIVIITGPTLSDRPSLRRSKGHIFYIFFFVTLYVFLSECVRACNFYLRFIR